MASSAALGASQVDSVKTMCYVAAHDIELCTPTLPKHVARISIAQRWTRLTFHVALHPQSSWR